MPGFLNVPENAPQAVDNITSDNSSFKRWPHYCFLKTFFMVRLQTVPVPVEGPDVLRPTEPYNLFSQNMDI